MNQLNVEETIPLIPNHDIPAAVQDTRKPSEKKLAVYILLASILFERIAFYSIALDISFTLQFDPKFKWSSVHSSTAGYVFSGTSYVWTLIFAIISDAKVGRARTIIIGFILYLIGYTLVTIIAKIQPQVFCPTKIINYNTTAITDEKCADWMLGTLVIIAIGAGAVKSNMVVFGAEQIQESKLSSQYFDKYVMAVNIGAMIEIWVIPYIQQDSNKYFIAYIVAATTLVLATLLFFLGWRYYIHVELNETVVSNCMPVIINAFQSWRKYRKIKHLIDKEQSSSCTSNLLDTFDNFIVEESRRIDERPSTFLDFAKAPNGGKFIPRIVNDVKSLRNAIVVFSLLVPYWLIYNQIETTFPLQGQRMNVIPNKSYIVPWISLGDPGIVIIGTLILNIFIYKYVNIQNRAMIITTKFVIGMCFALITMCMAGGVEVLRQTHCHTGSNVSNLTVYAQLPQNIGIGFTQLFAMVASCEFAFFAAPRSAQSLFMGLHFCSIGIASFLGAAYITVFSLISSNFDRNYIQNNATYLFQCPPENVKYWSFYTYFFVLAGFQLIFILIFLVCQKKFRIIKINPQQTETNQFFQH